MNINSDKETELDNRFDVIIIGGGPAGLSAAIYSARAKLKTLMLDKNPKSGALGMSNRIENYPGVELQLSGQDLLNIFRRQAEKFGANIQKAKVISVELQEDKKKVITSEKEYVCKAIIIATGSMGSQPTIQGEKEFTGKGVSYCAACDAAFFSAQEVAMVGRPEEIIEEIDLLAKFASKIYVLTSSKTLTPEQEEIFQGNSKIELLTGHIITGIEGDSFVRAIKVRDLLKNEKKINVSGVFLYILGTKPIIDFLAGSLDVTEDGCIIVKKSNMSTSQPGVFAAGDVTCKEIRQAVISAAEGCIAGLSVDKYINSRQRIKAQWS